jgi:E3 ubiquitin-protein ligase RHF
MEETKTSEAHLTSAAAFVEGGIQEACDDACSICLEAFFDSDPSTVSYTYCKFCIFSLPELVYDVSF